MYKSISLLVLYNEHSFDSEGDHGAYEPFRAGDQKTDTDSGDKQQEEEFSVLPSDWNVVRRIGLQIRRARGRASAARYPFHTQLI